MSRIDRKMKRRKPTAAERRKMGLPKDCTVIDVDLHDPDLATEHRDNFILAIRTKVAELDEKIGNWYRHRGECQIEGCDCGGNYLIEQAEIACNHLHAIKRLFGVTIIDDHRQFARLVKEHGGDDIHALLTATKRPQ